MINNFKITRELLITFLIGVSLGLIIMNVITPKKIAQLSDNNIIFIVNDKQLDANLYYEYLKNNSGIEVLTNIIDDYILSDLYPETEEMSKYINKKADDDENYYTTYTGKDEKDFYESINVKNRDEYLENLKIDYRRDLYHKKYLKTLIKDEEISNYYDTKIFGDIKTKYIAINNDNPNADEILIEIIEKLNNGYTYEQIVDEYKDIIVYEELGYVKYKKENYESYLNALLSMEDNSFSNSYIDTYYGKTIIFREDQKEKISFKDAKNDIIEIIGQNMDKEDPDLYERSLIELRKKYNIEFFDEKIESLYNKYCLQFY